MKRQYVKGFEEFVNENYSDVPSNDGYKFLYYDLTGRSNKNDPWEVGLDDALYFMGIDKDDPEEVEAFLEECTEGETYEERGFKLVCLETPY